MHSIMAKKHSDVFIPTWGERWDGEKLSGADSCDLKVSTKQPFGKDDNKILSYYVSWSLLTAMLVFY